MLKNLKSQSKNQIQYIFTPKKAHGLGFSPMIKKNIPRDLINVTKKKLYNFSGTQKVQLERNKDTRYKCFNDKKRNNHK